LRVDAQRVAGLDRPAVEVTGRRAADEHSVAVGEVEELRRQVIGPAGWGRSKEDRVGARDGFGRLAGERHSAAVAVSGIAGLYGDDGTGLAPVGRGHAELDAGLHEIVGHVAGIALVGQLEAGS
jgi:hypothetical protein